MEGKSFYINKNGNIICEYKIIEKTFEKSELLTLTQGVKESKDVWDKAKWSYDGFTITKKGAIRPFYFVLGWLHKNDLLTEAGISSYKDKNNLEIGLYRYMVKDEVAHFFDCFYDYWFEKQAIANYQIDPSLKFEGDENLDKYWEFYIENKQKTLHSQSFY